MKIISVNVGLPRKVEWKGKTVTTGIYKEPLPGSVNVRILNLEGDGQADLSVHGGRSKAVYAYPCEHYEFWRGELPDMTLPLGKFGENLSTAGLLEEEVRIGDEFRIGTTRLQVTEPRMPCYKLGIRFGRPDMVKLFLQSQRSGFYFAVAQEGRVQAGDAIEYTARASHGVTVADVVRLYTTDQGNIDLLRRVVALEALGDRWRGYFQHQLEKIAV